LRLAKELGYANVDKMLSEISAEQFQEWKDFSRLEPFGDEREDFRSYSVASAICNSMGAKTKPSEFVVDFEVIALEKEPPLPTTNDIARQMIAAGLPVVFGKRE
jgi:hypothetical protein